MKRLFLAGIASLMAAATTAVQAAPIRYAGALTFSPDGTLFIGDNVSSTVFAIPQPSGTGPGLKSPAIELDGIDHRIAAVLGVPADRVRINGMAVHPSSHAIYLSVSAGKAATPEVMRVALDGGISRIGIAGMTASAWHIADAPTADESFRDRTGDWPVPSADKYHAKAQTPMRSMTIVDMKFHNGELFVAGISNEEFASTLRRVAFPFNGKAQSSAISIYHVAHERYESRAPIRAMTFATIDGQDTLVAGYTCSPLVLIPVADLKNGAKVTGKTIGDMGNGQPLSMFSVSAYGQPMIFVTNAGHGPRMIPIAGLQKAVAFLPGNSPHNYPSDLSPEYPLGPVGKSVMFVGASLFADRLDDKFIVSVTRDAASGSLNLEALPITPLPMKLDQIWSEFDFRGGGPKSPS